MKNIKNNLKNIILGAFFVGALVSCEDQGYDEFEQQLTPTVSLNGEYFVDIIDEASGQVLAQHILHRTYDSGMNDGKMYIDDQQAGYYIKGLVDVDVNNLTFSTTGEENLVDPGTTFNVTEGKILKNAAHSRTGVAVDSIYFKGEFSYDPGTIIVFAGHKRTGFEEDEY